MDQYESVQLVASDALPIGMFVYECLLLFVSCAHVLSAVVRVWSGCANTSYNQSTSRTTRSPSLTPTSHVTTPTQRRATQPPD